MRLRKTFATVLATCATVFAVAVAPTAAHADWQVDFMSVLRPANGSSTRMVMNVRNGSSANMTPVQLYQLQSSGPIGDQIWRFLDTSYWLGNVRGYMIYNPKTGKCVDRRIDLGLANGNAVQMYDCVGTSNQIWYPISVNTSHWGLLKNGADQKCLDVRDAQYANGAPLQVWSCSSGNWNQRWNWEP
jgi:hypothetical protein